MARTTTFIAGVVAAGLTSITPMGAADYNGPSATHLTQKFRFVNNSCMIQGFVQAGEWNMYTAYVITYLLNPF